MSDSRSSRCSLTAATSRKSGRAMNPNIGSISVVQGETRSGTERKAKGESCCGTVPYSNSNMDSREENEMVLLMLRNLA